ncbi:MAG: ABC transporter permease [Candidatus Methanomethylicaceae archaeon]
MSKAIERRSIVRPSKHIRDFWWLLRSQLFHLRLAWFWYLIQMTFVPLSFLAFLWLFLGQARPEIMIFVITGSLVMNVSLGAMLSLGQDIGWLKEQNAYEYYASLPISKGVFLAALVTRGVLLSLPSTLLLLSIGTIFLNLQPNLGILVVLVLSAYAMSGLGAFIGFWSPTGQIASLATQIIQPLIVLFAPVYIPLEQLPYPLQITAHFLPTTYAAKALRKAFIGVPVLQLWPEILILVGFTIISLGLIPRKLDWRAK